MRKIHRLRPSPPMAVAIAALIVALAGTAMAAPTAINSVLNKKEKKQTKAIAKDQANQQIDTRAPGLTVGLANSVANDAISSAQVRNNGLDGVDVSTVTGASDENFPSIAANDCGTVTINTGVNVDNDVIAVSVDQTTSFANGGLTVHASDSNAANLIRVNVCNVTGAALDPPSANFRYIVFRR